jgi:di/tricarboxylate transporter
MAFPDIPNVHALAALLLTVLAVLFGANLSFVTPMAYKTNLLVMNAGGYKFMDFVKVGIPLTVIMWVALTAILSLGYGL